ncbi:MAG: hypothetical protein QOE70_6760 [Chthoniobacter sp.]|jgi:hypothetical protein|nr:hypothetical protein [Chthoniobacter sp.]
MPTSLRPFATVAVAIVALLSFAPTGGAKFTSATPPTSGPTVPGNRAVLRSGIAHAPENAPEAVKRAIWATNFLTRKPYVWGGGHSTFYDDGYDCSGTISFLLRHAGALNQPAASSELTRFGNGGRGRWITVYAKKGHVFATVAGLRLDTTGFSEEEGPRWRRDERSTWGFTARHPEGL